MNQPLCKRRSHPLWTISSWTHLPSSIATMLAHAFSTPTKVTAFGCTPSCCICWNSFCAFCPWPHLTCLNIMVVNILTWHLVVHSPSILYAPTFGLHVNKAIPQKDISLTTTLNYLLRSLPALLKCSYTSACIEHLNKRKAVKTHAFLLHFLEKLKLSSHVSSFNISSKPPIPWKIVHL